MTTSSPASGSLRVTALAGGVGGAKLAQGLQRAVAPGDLTVVVNTADDFDHYGLRVSPDLDTVLYTLGGIANPVTGWGIEGDTFHTLEAIAAYGRNPWFKLGDRDFATHILRTERLRAGATLTEVMAELAAGLGIPSRILPMTDDPVATMVETPAGTLEFQDYFVGRRQEDDVTGVIFAGIEAARLPQAVIEALTTADAIVLCPSNPIVSIGPILGIAGLRDALAQSLAPTVAVSPLVGGKALKGPADRMLSTLGHEVSSVGVARIYAGLIEGLVIDEVDRDLAPRIEELGVEVLVTATIMGGPDDRERLASETLQFARGLASRRAVGIGSGQ